ncbi:GMC oxidoreductase (plasmid) [Bradyrhizobium lupini]|uniref:GMC oxidoreductase n=1 Tax=Rhizobium lupini TaxID=136996 RepID=UPI00366FB1EA
MSLVDARLRVCGIDCLGLTDTSIMPKITSGNTNAPTQALARHAVTMLADDLKGPREFWREQVRPVSRVRWPESLAGAE